MVTHTLQPLKAAYPRQQPEEGAGIREEGDRIEGEAPGLSGAVRTRWLHPSGVSAAWRPLRGRV